MAMPQPIDPPGPAERPARGRRPRFSFRWSGAWWGWLVAALLCGLHGAALWVGVGGAVGLRGEWPILFADHGFHYHHGVVTRSFLRETGMTAGYDPSFMSGFPMSVVTGTSSTLENLFLLAFGGDKPAPASKVFTLACLAVLPCLVAMAAGGLRAGSPGVALAVLLYLVYFWTAPPVAYAEYGMTGYVLAVPACLVALALVGIYLTRGGFGAWLAAALACSAAFLIHLTSAMVLGPAALLAYAVGAIRARRSGRAFPVSRHLGLVAIAAVVLALNAFWLLPGFWLASTAGPSDFVFVHPEPVLGRLGEIFWAMPPIECFSLALGLVGLAGLARRDPVAAAGFGGFLLAGFSWGYLAGFSRTLDVFQPGRHTYALYSAACLLGGIGLGEVLDRLRASRPGRLDLVVLLGLAMVGVRVFGPDLAHQVRVRVAGPDTFLSSRPTERLLQVVGLARANLRPGERLLFEESGFAVPGMVDPFGGRHFSPILPHAAGIEVIGGPYLHTPVTTNFTQFGENKLFGKKAWGRDDFVRHARLYRPSAIYCWSPRAKSFCRSNPDLIRVVEDDGVIVFGRVIGFEGEAIRGTAKVQAGPNRLVVEGAAAEPGGDGLVVLRYHAVPYLAADPPVPIEPVFLEDDPVPFIGFRPPPGGALTLRMDLPPRSLPRK